MGRALQLLGALVLMLAPFLGWVQVTVLGVSLGLPGIFLHGAALLGIGMVVMLAVLLRLRRPGLSLLGVCLGASLTVLDLRTILERTEYVLRRWQLSLGGINETLGTLNIQPIEIFQRAASPWEYVGLGLKLSFVGLALILLGAAWETFSQPGKTPLSVLLGFPRCVRCGFRVGYPMHFCPGCGAGQETTRPCPRCQRPLGPGFRFCAECGSEA